MPLTATGMRLMMRQLQEVDDHPVDGAKARPSDDISEFHFDLDGPEDTPFAAGRFHVVLIFDEQYPEVPPKGYFRTKIFHPNVSDKGDICVNALKRDWSPSLGLRHIMMVIRCLLIEPNAESALNEEAGRLLLEDYSTYEKKAVMCTEIHAKRGDGVARFSGPEAKNAATGAATAKSGGGLSPAENPNISSVGGVKSATPEAEAAALKAKKAADKKKKALRRI